MVQLYAWFEFYFSVLLGMMICNNKFETKENIIQTKDKGYPLHNYIFPIYAKFIMEQKKVVI